MTCEKCGRDTEGFRRAGPGHPRIPYCKVCYYPKSWAYCAGCNRPKSAKAENCHACRQKATLAKRITKLEEDLKKARAHLEYLDKLGKKEEASK